MQPGSLVLAGSRDGPSPIAGAAACSRPCWLPAGDVHAHGDRVGPARIPAGYPACHGHDGHAPIPAGLRLGDSSEPPEPSRAPPLHLARLWRTRLPRGPMGADGPALQHRRPLRFIGTSSPLGHPRGGATRCPPAGSAPRAGRRPALAAIAAKASSSRSLETKPISSSLPAATRPLYTAASCGVKPRQGGHLQRGEGGHGGDVQRVRRARRCCAAGEGWVPANEAALRPRAAAAATF